MTLSVPPATLNAPTVPPGAMLVPKDPNNAKTDLFKNVLDAFQLPEENTADSSQQQTGRQSASTKQSAALESSIPTEEQQLPQHSSPQAVPAPFIPVNLFPPAIAAMLLPQPEQIANATSQGEPSEQEPVPSDVHSEARKQIADKPSGILPASGTEKSVTPPAAVNSVPMLPKFADAPAPPQPGPVAPSVNISPTTPTAAQPAPAQPAAPSQDSQSKAPAVEIAAAQADSPAGNLAVPVGAKPTITKNQARTITKVQAQNVATDQVQTIATDATPMAAVAAPPEPVTVPQSALPADAAADTSAPNPAPLDAKPPSTPAPQPTSRPAEPAPDPRIAANTSEPAPTGKTGVQARPTEAFKPVTPLRTPAVTPKVQQNLHPTAPLSHGELPLPAAVPLDSPAKPPALDQIGIDRQAAPAVQPQADTQTDPSAPSQPSFQPNLRPMPSKPAPDHIESEPQTSQRNDAEKAETISSEQVSTPAEENKLGKDVKDIPRPAAPIPAYNPGELLEQRPTQPAPLPPARQTSKPNSMPSKISSWEPSISSRMQRAPVVSPVSTSATTSSPVSPKPENLAFELRMLVGGSPADNPQHAENKSMAPLPELPAAQSKSAVAEPAPAAVKQPTPPQPAAPSQAADNTPRTTEAPASTTEKADTRSIRDSAPQRPAETANAIPRWSETGTPQAADATRPQFTAGMTKPAGDAASALAQETHIVTPEMPKAPAPSEILLHVSGGDHSSAAIRVADRAGTVNVSVHTPDPALRDSLRSNLGELSAQLGQQGWKADATRPTVFATPSDHQPDSHARGQQSPQQQHPSGGERQASRERRNPRDWQQELEQQFSNGSALSGGRK